MRSCSTSPPLRTDTITSRRAIYTHNRFLLAYAGTRSSGSVEIIPSLFEETILEYEDRLNLPKSKLVLLSHFPVHIVVEILIFLFLEFVSDKMILEALSLLTLHKHLVIRLYRHFVHPFDDVDVSIMIQRLSRTIRFLHTLLDEHLTNLLYSDSYDTIHIDHPVPWTHPHAPDQLSVDPYDLVPGGRYPIHLHTQPTAFEDHPLSSRMLFYQSSLKTRYQPAFTGKGKYQGDLAFFSEQFPPERLPQLVNVGRDNGTIGIGRFLRPVLVFYLFSWRIVDGILMQTPIHQDALWLISSIPWKRFLLLSSYAFGPDVAFVTEGEPINSFVELKSILTLKHVLDEHYDVAEMVLPKIDDDEDEDEDDEEEDDLDDFSV